MFGNNKRWDDFVVIEGIDGAGTSTQRELLAEAYRKSGRSVLDSWEPTEGKIGCLIRDALRSIERMQKESLAYLFAADRFEHLFGKNGVHSHLKQGGLAISDRYFFSSLAYQSKDMPMEWVWDLNKHFPLPEYIVFIDIDIELAALRRQKRSEPQEIFEYDDILRHVRSTYHDLWQSLQNERPDIQLLRLSGEGSVKDIHVSICDFLHLKPIL